MSEHGVFLPAAAAIFDWGNHHFWVYHWIGLKEYHTGTAMALSLVFSRGEPYRKHYETAISKSKKTIKKPMVSGYDFPLKPPGSS